MQINHVKINNILGIDHLEFEAGQFVTIGGANGLGKTSVLEAIKAALGKGQDATLLRSGADKGEVVLVLDNGGSISARVTAAGTTRSVKAADGKTSAKPAAALAALVDLMSVNPVDFLLAKPTDRARVLLESMPLEADVETLATISGVEVTAQPGVHALQTIAAVRQQVYEDRTGTNRAVREKDATINQLRAAMPAAPAGIDGSEDELMAQLAVLDNTRDSMLGKIEKQLAKMRGEHEAALESMRAEVESVRQRMEAERVRFVGIENRAQAAASKARDDLADAAAPIGQALAAIRANRDAAGRRQATLDTIKTMTEQLADLQADAERQTTALEAIDVYRTSLLASLPIPGLEVRDGEIFRGGVPFDRLNTAQRVQIAVDVAKVRAGRLSVCCVDGLELMSTETFTAFRDAAIASDLQMFVTRVGDGEFSIDSQP